MNDTNLLDEFNYYKTNQDWFVERYDGKVITLKGCKVLGCFETEREAVLETRKQHERGTFLVQRVSEGVNAYTATISTPFVGSKVQ